MGTGAVSPSGYIPSAWVKCPPHIYFACTQGGTERYMKIGVAISGGRATGGYAAIGVLFKLKEMGITVWPISVSSMPSLIACMLACGYTQKETVDIYDRFLKKHKKNRRTGAVKRSIAKIFKNKGVRYLSDLKGGIAINCVDILSGEKTVFTKPELCRRDRGVSVVEDIPIADAVTASLGLSFTNRPIRYKGRRLADPSAILQATRSALHLMGIDRILALSINDCDGERGEVNVGITAISSVSRFIPEISPSLSVTVFDRTYDTQYTYIVGEMTKEKLSCAYERLFINNGIDRS